MEGNPHSDGYLRAGWLTVFVVAPDGCRLIENRASRMAVAVVITIRVDFAVLW